MSTSDRERRVDEAIAAYLQAHEAGAPPEREVFLAAHPDLRAELASFLDAREMLQRRAPVDTDPTLAPTTAPLGVVRYFGDYELLREIGRGGMGVVYRARQVSLGRVVAVKMLAGWGTAGDGERLRQEATMLAELEHPNVVPVYEVGLNEGQVFFAMRLIEGSDLAKRLPELRQDLRQAVRVLAEVARAVHHAHARGILHRDLKPANVLLDMDGKVFVTDFGLARRLEGGAGLTQSGAIVGTPAYLAPEQAMGAKELTAAADVWAMGVMLYEVLTGRLPFAGETPLETVGAVVAGQFDHPRLLRPDLPDDLEFIALRTLAYSPKARYASAAALADDLEDWLGGRPLRGRPRRPLLSRLALSWSGAGPRCRTGQPSRTRKLLAMAPWLLALVALACSTAVYPTRCRLARHAAERDAAWAALYERDCDRAKGLVDENRGRWIGWRGSGPGSWRELEERIAPIEKCHVATIRLAGGSPHRLDEFYYNWRWYPKLKGGPGALIACDVGSSDRRLYFSAETGAPIPEKSLTTTDPSNPHYGHFSGTHFRTLTDPSNPSESRLYPLSPQSTGKEPAVLARRTMLPPNDRRVRGLAYFVKAPGGQLRPIDAWDLPLDYDGHLLVSPDWRVALTYHHSNTGWPVLLNLWRLPSPEALARKAEEASR